MRLLEWVIVGLVPAAFLLAAFVLGAAVGSGLNVLIYRLPRGKSPLWPPSSCGVCLSRIRWYDNIPILGYLHLRGRCRDCGTRFSPRYMIVELATGLGFAGLLGLEVFANWNNLPALKVHHGALAGDVPPAVWLYYLVHVYLFSLAVMQFCCRLDGNGLPSVAALPGLLAGPLVGAFAPWPWPSTFQDILAPESLVDEKIASYPGLQIWPFEVGWIGRILLNSVVWWNRNENRIPYLEDPRTGLLTWLIGLAVPWLLYRVGRWLTGKRMSRAASGDLIFLMTFGGLLGWQAATAALALALLPTALRFLPGVRVPPFGAWLAVTAVLALLGLPLVVATR